MSAVKKGLCDALCQFLTVAADLCGLFSVSEPQGQVNEKYIVGGDNVTLSCRVVYHGPETPYIEWSQWTDDNNNSIHVASEWTNTNESDALISVKVSELGIIVPEDVEYLPPYTCTVRFYSYNQRRKYYSYVNRHYQSYYYPADVVYTAYNWTTPEIKVSCKYYFIHWPDYYLAHQACLPAKWDIFCHCFFSLFFIF